MLYILVAILAVVLSIYYIYDRQERKKYAKFYSIPQPRWFPIIGSSWILFNKNILKGASKTLQDYGSPCLIYIPYRTYLSSRSKDMKILLNHPASMEKSREYHYLQSFFGESLLLAKVPKWKKNRKIISRSFKQIILDEFMDTFYEKSCILVDMIKKENYSNSDVIHLFGKFTIDNFSEATLGVESLILQDPKEHLFVTSLKEIQQIAFNRIGNLIKMSDFLYQFVADSKLLNNYMDYARTHVQQIMDRKNALRTQDHDVMVDVQKLPVLDLLLQVSEKEKLSDKYIATEMILFAGAATDTTAYTFTYICIALGIHQDVQQKLYDEVIKVVGHNGVIDSKDLANLKYTEMVISEVQRLAPAVPMVGRMTNEDIDLGDIVIPKNTSIILSFIELHRDPEIWENPFEFNPDRFLPEEIAKRPQYSFLPFSGGPRNCIGFKYAMMVMKTTIANLVRNFHITSKHKSILELDFESSVVMVPTNPIDLHFTPRNNV